MKWPSVINCPASLGGGLRALRSITDISGQHLGICRELDKDKSPSRYIYKSTQAHESLLMLQ